MRKLTALLAAAALLCFTASGRAEAEPAAQGTFDRLLAAAVANDYDGFVAGCDAAMKAAMTRTVLEGLSQQLAPRARRGYEASYLGALNKQGFAVHLWRLRFKDGGDDVLATLSLKEGKAGGFYLR